MTGQDGVHYYDSIEVAAVSNKKKAARFLTQATFGPRYDEIAALEGNDFAGWIAAQMALSPSLHRAHYRRRSHPRLTYADALVESSNWGLTSGGAAGPCDAGSRWRKFAFTTEDIGRFSAVSHEMVAHAEAALRLRAAAHGRLQLPTAAHGCVRLCATASGCLQMPPAAVAL